YKQLVDYSVRFCIIESRGRRKNSLIVQRVSCPVKRLILLPLLVLLLPIQVRERGTAADVGFARIASAPERAPLQALSDYTDQIRARGQSLDDQGVLIESLDDGKPFAQHNADVTFNPASVMKLATSLMALDKLGPDYRYRTNILADG